jgi:DNA-directed RNA polymerase specialized sigma24 family protein
METATTSESTKPRPLNFEDVVLPHLDAAYRLEDAMRDLPERFRELLVLRELEGCSYQELADLLRIPIGSVMSGLSRGRTFVDAGSPRRMTGEPDRCVVP